MSNIDLQLCGQDTGVGATQFMVGGVGHPLVPAKQAVLWKCKK